MVGLLTTVHWVPFQCSVRVAVEAVPTAHTSLGEIAVIPYRLLLKLPAFGLETMLHWPQFCASAAASAPPSRSKIMVSIPASMPRQAYFLRKTPVPFIKTSRVLHYQLYLHLFFGKVVR